MGVEDFSGKKRGFCNFISEFVDVLRFAVNFFKGEQNVASASRHCYFFFCLLVQSKDIVGSHIAFVQAKDVVSVQAAAASLFDTAPHFLHDLIRSEIRKTTSKRNYVNVCSSSLSQKFTITIRSQSVSNTE